jgi:sarcosine oxidase subunit beta
MATCDIAIIGGGVIGTSIAWHLARRAVGRVVLFEKSHVGAGSSGKSGAIIRQHYSNELTASMALQSLRVFEKFDHVVGGPPVFTRTGMALIVNQRDRAGLQANLIMQRGLGIDTRIVSRQELLELDANVRMGDDEVAAWESEAGYVEAVQVVASFADAARRAGAEVREGVEVQEILVEKDRVVGVRTSEGRIDTCCVVLAAGPWAARLGRTVGLELPVQSCRTQVALFRCPPDLSRRCATYGDFVHGIYFKPTHGEMIHVGSIGGEEIREPVDPDNYNEAANSDWLPQIRQRLSRRYPGMLRGYGRGGYGALYAITPDWHPIIDRLPGFDGLFAAVGFSGHGFKMSPLVGQLMAELVVDGQARTLNIAPLRATRFAENELVKAAYTYGVMG